MMDEVPDGWDPHMKLEYLKVVIRSVVAGLVGKSRKELKEEIIELESELNDMKLLKEKACSLRDEVTRVRRSDLIDLAERFSSAEQVLQYDHCAEQRCILNAANKLQFGKQVA